MTVEDWVRNNLRTKGDVDDSLPGSGDEVVLWQGIVDSDGTLHYDADESNFESGYVRREHVEPVDRFTVKYADIIEDYQAGNIDKATFISNAQSRATDPSSAGTAINNNDPLATTDRDWTQIDSPQDEDRLDSWQKWDSEGRI